MTELTVLVGPNGCGKSTVLDALLLATSRNPSDACGRVVLRRRAMPAGAQWMLHRSGDLGPAEIAVTAVDGTTQRCEVTARVQSVTWSAEVEGTTISCGAEFPEDGNGFTPNNGRTIPAVGGVEHVRFVEPSPGALQAPLDRVYTEGRPARGAQCCIRTPRRCGPRARIGTSRRPLIICLIE